MKICTRCQKEKPLDAFYIDKRLKDGVASRCKQCQQECNVLSYQNNKDARKEHARAYRMQNKDYVNSRRKKWRLLNGELIRSQDNNSRYKRKYGITLQEKENRWIAQEKKCAICLLLIDTLTKAHTDHDHITGRVRGILCSSCNCGIGFLNEDYQILQNAIFYLKNFS